MLRSRVKVTTMLLVLTFSLTAGFCSAKDNKPPDIAYFKILTNLPSS